MLAAAFVAFVVWNRGIVLGDRSAHHPVLHCTQPLYFALFAMFSAWPLLVDWQVNIEKINFFFFR
jgi:alpha-1,2-glucosyltransferase